MACIAIRKVEKQLRTLGLRPARRGNGTGHAVWSHDDGRHITLVSRHGDVLPEPYLYALSRELSAKGFCERKEFVRALRA